MKRNLISILFLVLLLPVVLAIPDLEIEKTEMGDVVIKELSNPAVFEFKVNNLGPPDNFQIYSLIGVSMSPRGLFYLPTGKTTIEVRAFPNEDVRKITGLFLFEYQLKGQDSGIFKDQLLINILPLEESVAVSADNILPNDKRVNVVFKNIKNSHLENLEVEFESTFFEDFTEKISLGPLEETSFKAVIDEKKIRKLSAGPFVITATIRAKNTKTRVEGIINYLEREGVAVNKTTSGFLIRKTTTIKTNVGNTPIIVDIESKRDIVTRLFTGYSINPETSDRGGFFVEYVWQKELQPGESYSIISTTNYTFPFILIILIVLIGIMAKAYAKTSLTLTKRVSYVRTKGGEFALKIRLHVKANKHLENVELSDQIPATTKLYEKFGKHPDKIDEHSRKIHWNLGSLNSGEEQVFSYIIYSKLKVIGRFELPLAHTSFEHNGNVEHVSSNRTYFVADTSSIEED